MEISNSVYRSLCKITGKAFCSNKMEDRVCYAYDAINRNAMPDIVLFPETSRQIAAILRLANQEKIPVVPRGAGSGTTGGSIPVKGGIVLVTTRLNTIKEIDCENYIAVAEPGVVTADFAAAVETQGMFYPPDPSSASFSTLGGNLAECAGGPRALKYGVTRDYVTGLEFVSPTGDIIHTGVRTKKGVVGYDLTRLLIGSEGTLGVITSAVFKLLPLPESVQTQTAVFATMEAAAKTVSAIIHNGIVPRAIEFMDNESIQCAQSYSGIKLPTSAGAILIIESDGEHQQVQQCMAKVRDIALQHGALQVDQAADNTDAERLWAVRKSVSPALYMYGPDKINEDIVVPRSCIPAMVSKIQALKKETGLMMVCFGHAGDGNIHFNIMLDKKNKADFAKAESVINTIFDYVIRLGGTLSGEHGVGTTKQKYISKELRTAEQDLMKRIKQTFDPNNIMNPGKIFSW